MRCTNPPTKGGFLALALGLLLALGSAACDGEAAQPTLPAGPGAAPQPSATPAPAASGGWFTDIARAAGVDFVHDAGRTPEKHLPETMGSGGALCDLDGDGDLDLYLVQSGPLPDLPSDRARPDNRVYLNDGAGRFTDATAQSGAGRGRGYGMGVTPGDVDGDGDVDLYLSNFGPDLLLLNDGHAHFSDGTAAAGLGDERWTTAATFFDADQDGDLDLFVTGYVHVDTAHPLWCGEQRPGYRSYCHPDAYAGLAPRFWRNDGRGRFTEATQAAGLATLPDEPGKGLGALAFDVEPDGDLDLYVANDSVENRLWINAGDGSFSDGTLLSGTGVDGQGRTEAGMGLATGDVDGDLDIDLFVTNFDDESNTLYRNDGAGLFTDATTGAALEAPSRMPVGFGTVFADFDNDGDLDLVVTNGHIIDNIELYNDGKSWRQRSQMFLNDGAGIFREVTGTSGDLARELLVGRGLYAGDIDGDLDVDLLLTQNGGPALLLRNDGAPESAPGSTAVPAPGGAVLLTGLPAGTRVRATLDSGRVLLREAGTQTSYLGQSAPELHLGLGAARLQSLELAPPGGSASTWSAPAPLASGRLHFVQRADGLQLQDRPTDGATAPVAAPAPASDSAPRGPDKP